LKTSIRGSRSATGYDSIQQQQENFPMSEFTDYLNDLFAQFGPINVRRMFGGYGIYHQGLMFALVVKDTLYLKADAESAELFRQKQLEQFEYLKAGKKIRVGYYAAPVEALEDATEMSHWATMAWRSAVRGKSTR
jgi:DNA transformation protein